MGAFIIPRLICRECGRDLSLSLEGFYKGAIEYWCDNRYCQQDQKRNLIPIKSIDFGSNNQLTYSLTVGDTTQEKSK